MLYSPKFELAGASDVSVSYWRWYTNDTGSSPEEDHWLVEQAKVMDEYLPESHRLALERFRAAGLYPGVIAPSFNRHGGLIEPGFELRIDSRGGYDPRRCLRHGIGIG